MEKGIAPVLAQMEVGDVESWPIERLDSVRVSAGRFKLKNRRSGWNYRIKTEGLSVEVTRTA